MAIDHRDWLFGFLGACAMFEGINTEEELKAYLNKWAKKLKMTELTDEEFIESAKFADYVADKMEE